MFSEGLSQATMASSINAVPEGTKLPSVIVGRSYLVSPGAKPNQLTAKDFASSWAVELRSRFVIERSLSFVSLKLISHAVLVYKI